jgi:biotin carboxylase
MAHNVLMIMPGFPGEMPHFTRGLSEVGATVWGVAPGGADELPELARRHLSHYRSVPELFTDTDAAIRAIREWTRGTTLHRVSCLWEPGVELAAAIRAALGVPGQSPAQAKLFRNKELMKQALSDGGVRVPRHVAARTVREVQAAAERVGFPCIIKPIAGAGSQDTFRCDSAEELEAALKQLGHIEEVSVEEFIDGEEFTYDTICAGGRQE